jgi:hypothetical protein
VCACAKTQFWEKHVVDQFYSGLNHIYRPYISTSFFPWEMLDVDSELLLRVLRVTELLRKGCSQRLENLGVKETPMFVAEATGPGLFLKLQLRFLVVSVLYICTSAQARHRSCVSWNFVLESLNFQLVASYLVFDLPR